MLVASTLIALLMLVLMMLVLLMLVLMMLVLLMLVLMMLVTTARGHVDRKCQRRHGVAVLLLLCCWSTLCRFVVARCFVNTII